MDTKWPAAYNQLALTSTHTENNAVYALITHVLSGRNGWRFYRLFSGFMLYAPKLCEKCLMFCNGTETESAH